MGQHYFSLVVADVEGCLKLYDFGFLLLMLAIIGGISLANPRECEADDAPPGSIDWKTLSTNYGGVILSVDNATGKFKWHPDADRLIAELPPERSAMKSILKRLRECQRP